MIKKFEVKNIRIYCDNCKEEILDLPRKLTHFYVLSHDIKYMYDPNLNLSVNENGKKTS